jgi:hypothetical protein
LDSELKVDNNNRFYHEYCVECASKNSIGYWALTTDFKPALSGVRHCKCRTAWKMSNSLDWPHSKNLPKSKIYYLSKSIAKKPMTLIEDKSIIEIQQRYKKMGSVIDLCAFDIPDLRFPDYEILVQAAKAAMDIISDRYVQDWQQTNPTLPMEEYFRIRQVEGSTPIGTKISWADFFGDGFNFETKQIDMFTYHDGVKASETELKGLSHALLSPPYGLRLMPAKKLSVAYGIEEQAKLTEVFKDFLTDALSIRLNEGTDHLEIYSWSLDWSNYFDAGKEWWGAFYWTVLDKRRRKITVIAASTTD